MPRKGKVSEQEKADRKKQRQRVASEKKLATLSAQTIPVARYGSFQGWKRERKVTVLVSVYLTATCFIWPTSTLMRQWLGSNHENETLTRLRSDSLFSTYMLFFLTE
jgi:hypothetical protein